MLSRVVLAAPGPVLLISAATPLLSNVIGAGGAWRVYRLLKVVESPMFSFPIVIPVPGTLIDAPAEMSLVMLTTAPAALGKAAAGLPFSSQFAATFHDPPPVAPVGTQEKS